MNSKFKCSAVLILMLAPLFQITADAHTLQGAIPASKTAVVRWRITCYEPAAQMIFRLRQVATKNFSVNLTITSLGGIPGQVATTTTMPIKNIWTPYSSIQGGAGDYLLELSKVGKNPNQAITYTVEDHCDTASGEHTQQSDAVRVR
ncbi:MAG: hypothetical protein RLZZ627_2040 [Pseudomonadota bacterium]|jgi:hypothetical protein